MGNCVTFTSYWLDRNIGTVGGSLGMLWCCEVLLRKFLRAVKGKQKQNCTVQKDF